VQIYAVNLNSKINLIATNAKSLAILILVLLFSFSGVCFAQAPPLGTTSTFALFTAVGAINSTGTTNVTGDIGTDVGAFTGFPPGIIAGSTHIADAISAQAAIDVDAAYNFLTGVTCSSAIGPNLGNNQVLTPNVYCIGAASTLTGNLILDGLGNPNALFIFKINGALTTSIFSNIVLVNLTNVCNIYWQINGLFSLGDNSIFRGTVIGNGAINLLDSSSIEGRGLSRAGAISLTNNSINNASLTCNLITLPIELTSFNSDCENKKAVLKWTTATETNSDYCLIERSADAITWKTIGRVLSVGNSTTLNNYSFTDEEPFIGNCYYHLKQTDFKGDFKYSNIIYSENCKQNFIELDIYPNPGNGKINFLFNEDKSQFISISVYNSHAEKIYNSESYQSAIDLSDKNAGIYFLHFNLTSGVIIKKIVIE